MPLSGLLEEVAAAAAASDGQSLRGPQSVTDGSEDGSGLKMREPSISAAAQPAELGWEELPSVLAVDLDAEGGMKEVGSLQVGGAEHQVCRVCYCRYVFATTHGPAWHAHARRHVELKLATQEPRYTHATRVLRLCCAVLRGWVLQDLTSLDGTYEEEGMGTDDSSSTGAHVAALPPACAGIR